MDINKKATVRLTISRILAYAFVLFFCFMCLFFILLLVVNATKTNFQLQGKFSLVPGTNFLANLKSAWTDSSINIPRGMLNSLLVTLTPYVLTT